jgi:hypothetical protein
MSLYASLNTVRDTVLSEILTHQLDTIKPQFWICISR